MSQRVAHIFDRTPMGRGTMTAGGAGGVVLVIWDSRPGKPHPCLREELVLLDDQDQVRVFKPFGRERDRDDRGRGRDRDRTLVASA